MCVDDGEREGGERLCNPRGDKADEYDFMWLSGRATAISAAVCSVHAWVHSQPKGELNNTTEIQQMCVCSVTLKDIGCIFLSVNELQDSVEASYVICWSNKPNSSNE